MVSTFNFNEVVKALEETGFYDVALPFVLIFTLIFAILQKIQLFGTQSKNINIMLALVIAFFTVRVPWVISTINLFLPKISLIVLVIVIFLLIMGLFGAEGSKFTGGAFFVMLLVAVVGVLWALFSSSSKLQLPSWLKATSTDAYIMVAFIVGIIIIIAFLSSEPKPGGSGLIKDIARYFKGQ
ncbi:hypothetical protein HZB88_01580 [archaeon]|nr:hypothetical protein [archaeon]